MMQYGKAAYIPQLKQLWRECFADDNAYIDAFFAALYADENVLLAQENGRLCCASFFLPGKIKCADGWQDIRYVYALATDMQFRGRGLAGALLRHAHACYGTPLLAEPADESLAKGFYEPFGFRYGFYLRRQQELLLSGKKTDSSFVRAAELLPAAHTDASRGGNDMHIARADAGAYRKLRDNRFAAPGYVAWQDAHIAFAIAMHRAEGGDALLVKQRGQEELLLYYRGDSRLIVTETTLTPQAACAALTEWLPDVCGEVVVQLRTESGIVPKTEETAYKLVGMGYGLSDVREGYLNLTLD